MRDFTSIWGLELKGAPSNRKQKKSIPVLVKKRGQRRFYAGSTTKEWKKHPHRRTKKKKEGGSVDVDTKAGT